MANKLNIFDGTDWADGDILFALDLVTAHENNASHAGAGSSQGAYQTLQANDVFENKDFLASDEFTDSTGTNNTVNTGTSTANFATDHYELSISGGTGSDITATADNIAQSFGSFTTRFGLKIDALANCVLKSLTKNSSVTATTAYIYTSGGSLLESVAFSGDVATFAETTFLASGSTFFVTVDAGGASYAVFRDASPFAITDSSQIDIVEGSTGTSTPDANNLYNIVSVITRAPAFAASDTVVCDTATLTLDGTEENITVYADLTLPTNTSTTVDISDGSTTLSAQAITNKSTGIIDITSLSSGTLELTFNLASTDDSVTPEIQGYGVFVFK